MSRNMNRRFFSEFLSVLSRKVDPSRDMSPSSDDLHSPLKCDGQTQARAPPLNDLDAGMERKKTMTREAEVNGSSLSLHSQEQIFIKLFWAFFGLSGSQAEAQNKESLKRLYSTCRLL